MRIVNITATVIMEELFNLDYLYNNLPDSEKTHVWVKARIPPYGKYTAFYGSGKFLITGVKNYDELNEVANNVVNYLKNHDVNNEIKEKQINNHVITDEINFLIDLDSLFVKLSSNNVSYEPEQFPGLIYKDENNITFMLFNNGKINITGVKSLEGIESKINNFKQLIYSKTLEDKKIDDETLIQLTFIKNAPNREKVLHSFENEDFLRPKNIAKKTNIHPNNISKVLKDLCEHDLVYVNNPEYHVPRLYGLTPKGKKILNLLDQYERN